MGKTRSIFRPRERWSALLWVSLCLLSGCQCGPLYEGYAGFVDGVSDQLPLLERLYVPQLDISRIGQPDWCRSPINRLLAPCECRNAYCEPAVAMVATDAEPSDVSETDEESPNLQQADLFENAEAFETD